MRITRDGQTVTVTMTDKQATGLCEELLWARGLDDSGPGKTLWAALDEAGFDDD